MRKFMFLFLTFLAIVIGGAYVLGIKNSYFFIYPWLDTPLHLLGGIFVGTVACLFLPRSMQKVIYVLLAAFIVGILWELFELITKLTEWGTLVYFKDTFHDLALDCLGGLIASLFIVFRKN